MNYFPWTTSVVVALAISCVSCDKFKPPPPELQKPPVPSSQANPPEAQAERAAFAQAAQKELDELRTVIAEFRTRAAAASQQTKARLEADVEKLEAESREAQQRLVELKSATAESWTQLKESFGKSREKLKNAIENARKPPA